MAPSNSIGSRNAAMALINILLEKGDFKKSRKSLLETVLGLSVNWLLS